ncbi:YopT-type cysteine protease domain-containing protein [Legionella erythra]|uniref:Ankyrin repeat-containing protein n=1 Tax=Legionella erythra TaxID=448 RepID=A0A0W0TW79_LEGER|nr:YopT-type cysteine protease domain-containing protein [Legionella erythra]KTD00024.1 ankyrin repeat-containing protein [Legionella erythra]
MNKSGVCNGLAAGYIKYALQGQIDQFQTILNTIANLPPNAEWNEDVYSFAKDVAKSFMPEEYDKTLNQLNNLATLDIAGKKLAPAFDLAMTTSDTNWTQILKEIALRDDEAMIVRSVNHAVAISKKAGNYIIYDPNYRGGFKAFRSEREVIHELHFNVFGYTGMLGFVTDSLDLSDALSPIAVPLELYGPLGLHVQVVRHPEQSNTPRSFPDIGGLFEKYLNTDQAALSSAGNYGITNMFWAILLDNKDAVNALYAKGFKNDRHLISACMVAAAVNATRVLPLFLSQIKKESDISHLPEVFMEALGEGRQEALAILLQDSNGRTCFEDIILMRGNAATYLHGAAAGGNRDVLQYMLDAYQQEGAPPLNEKAIAEKILAGNAIGAAIGSKSVACVNLLYQQLKKIPGEIDDLVLLTHLLQAIRANQLPMVEFFIAEIHRLPECQELLFEAVKLNPSLVAKTDISILRLLQANHVHFSPTAQAIIDKKESHPASSLSFLDSLIYEITDFIKEVLLKRDETEENIHRFKTMKSGLFKHKSPKADEAIEHSPLPPSPEIGQPC